MININYFIKNKNASEICRNKKINWSLVELYIGNNDNESIKIFGVPIMYANKVMICGVDTAKLPLLKEKEKEALLKRVKQGDKSAREELINGNLRLVLSVIQRFTGRGENLDDLFQVGCIGLIKSIDNFDITQNVRFSTYAVPMKCSLGKKERKTLGNGSKSSNFKGFRTFRLPIEFRLKPLQRK